MSLSQSLQRVYPLAPTWMQNLGISLYGIGYRNERLAGKFDQHVAGFREREQWSESRFREYLINELRTQLLHAYAQVPHYRNAWQSQGIDREILNRMTFDDLQRLPITRKDQFRSNPKSFLAENIASRERLCEYSSSGSTGTPVRCSYTVDAHRRFTAAREARSFNWAGTSILAPRSMIGGRMIVPHGTAKTPLHRYNWAERQVYLSAFHIAPANVQSYVLALEHYRPHVLTGYASAHYLLARMMLQQGVSLSYRPDALVLSSERLTAEMKSVIVQAFGARPYEEYGAVENALLASECPHGRLHVHPDFGIVEIVDETGHPVPPGRQGRILCTGLLNPAQPLIRYDIGDLGSWSASLCPCGKNLFPVLAEVVGRVEDVVTGPDGRQMVRFHWVFIDLPNVIEGQVIQEANDRFHLKVVATDAFGESECAVIRKRFETHLGSVHLSITRVPAIERTSSGKFKAVISHRAGIEV